MNKNKLAQAGLMAALCYIGFAFFKIDIPVGPEKTAFHLGNVFCVLGALLLGGPWGGLAGAVAEYMAANGYSPKIESIGIPDTFVEHGTPQELYDICKMDNNSVLDAILKYKKR